MNAKTMSIVLILAAFASGCRDARNHLKMRRLTSDLLHSISNMDRQLSSEDDSSRFMDSLGKSMLEQRAIIENARRRLVALRSEIYRHSKVRNPTVDQIRYEELDHEKLLERFNKILADHEKGMKRLKEQQPDKNKA